MDSRSSADRRQPHLRQVAFQKQAQSRRHARTAQSTLGCPRVQATTRDRLRSNIFPYCQGHHPYRASSSSVAELARQPTRRQECILARFIDAQHPDHVCLLDKSLYGLKQAPQAWYQQISGELHSIGFTSAVFDTSLFVYKRGNDVVYLLLYVDDIVLTASSSALLQCITQHLGHAFELKDLGPLHFFLGIHVQRSSSGFFLHQAKYAEVILDRASMVNCKPAPTPVDTSPMSSATDGSSAPDGSFYRSIAGALQYLTLTRPNLAYAIK
jgi:hypothetical protein